MTSSHPQTHPQTNRPSKTSRRARHQFTAALFALLTGILAIPASAQPKGQVDVVPDIVDAGFVSPLKEIEPDKPFLIGLHLKHKKGWHTYWRNPGDVGLAPMFDWELPVGADVGDIQWQAPLVIKMFDITAWGFSGCEALHVVEVTPPPGLKPGDTLRIGADITWMVCGKTCHPGNYRFDIVLRVGAKAKPNPRWEKRFQKAVDDLPRTCAAWESRAKRQGDKIILELRRARPAEANADIKLPYFFCGSKQVSSNNDQRISQRKGIIRMILPAADYGDPDAGGIEGIVFAKEGWRRDGTLPYMRVRVPYSSFGDP